MLGRSKNPPVSAAEPKSKQDVCCDKLEAIKTLCQSSGPSMNKEAFITNVMEIISPKSAAVSAPKSAAVSAPGSADATPLLDKPLDKKPEPSKLSATSLMNKYYNRLGEYTQYGDHTYIDTIKNLVADVKTTQNLRYIRVCCYGYSDINSNQFIEKRLQEIIGTSEETGKELISNFDIRVGRDLDPKDSTNTTDDGGVDDVNKSTFFPTFYVVPFLCLDTSNPILTDTVLYNLIMQDLNNTVYFSSLLNKRQKFVKEINADVQTIRDIITGIKSKKPAIFYGGHTEFIEQYVKPYKLVEYSVFSKILLSPDNYNGLFDQLWRKYLLPPYDFSGSGKKATEYYGRLKDKILLKGENTTLEDLYEVKLITDSSGGGNTYKRTNSKKRPTKKKKKRNRRGKTRMKKTRMKKTRMRKTRKNKRK